VRWWLSEVEADTPKEGGDGALKEVYSRILALSRIQDLVAWGRSRSFWPFNSGLSCC
jgi:NADH-quinone oxidoreductase subunit B